MKCENRCVVTEAVTIPENNMPPPAGGGGGGDFNGIIKADTPTVALTGDGKNTPLRATVKPFPINFEISMSALAGWTTINPLVAYPVALPCTLKAGLPGFQYYAHSVANASSLTLQKSSGGTVTNIGSIALAADGTMTVTFMADVQFAAGDVFIIRAASDATFDVVALTIIGLRDLAIAA